MSVARRLWRRILTYAGRNEFIGERIRRSSRVTHSRLGQLGQFGNQLFFIAAVLGYAKRFDCQPILPRWFCVMRRRDYGELFPKIEKYRGDMNGTEVKVERCAYGSVPFVYDADLNGFFQSEKNFDNVKDEIRELFSEPPAIANALDEYCREHGLSRFNAMHFRFYTSPDTDGFGQNETHVPLPDWYFLEAIERLSDGAPIVIATDDKERLRSFIERTRAKGIFHILTFADALLDFYMIARAEKIAIANSSFSWWAAYLSEAKEIYAPPHSIWFSGPLASLPRLDMSDLYPAQFKEIQRSFS